MKFDAYLDLGFVACEPLPLPYLVFHEPYTCDAINPIFRPVD